MDKWVWIGIAAIGALLLLPEKKRARKTAMSGLVHSTRRGHGRRLHGKRWNSLGMISLDVKKRCVPDITRKKIRCRVQEPKEFDGFFTRRSTTPGVSYVMGLVDGKGITQSVMFDKKIWGTKQAKTWFNRNINRLLGGDRRALNLQG